MLAPRTWCKKLKECETSEFEKNYDKMWECVDEAEGTWTLQRLFQGDCDFNRDKAKECLKDVRAASCGEFEKGFSSCDQVYDNCSGGAFDSGNWTDDTGW